MGHLLIASGGKEQAVGPGRQNDRAASRSAEVIHAADKGFPAFLNQKKAKRKWKRGFKYMRFKKEKPTGALMCKKEGEALM